MLVVLLVPALVACAVPVVARSQEQSPHVTMIEGLRVLHAWSAATEAGSDALIYLEIENATAKVTTLTGARTMGAELELVGWGYTSAGETLAVLAQISVPPGRSIRLEPKGLALKWADIPIDLVEGTHPELEIDLGGHRLKTGIEIGASDATAHSHGGHDH